jgi:hypothetical protein
VLKAISGGAQELLRLVADGPPESATATWRFVFKPVNLETAFGSCLGIRK